MKKQQREAKNMEPLWKVKSFEQHILTTADREGDTNRQTKRVSNAQDKQTHGHGHGTARHGTVHDSTGEQSKETQKQTNKQGDTQHKTPQRTIVRRSVTHSSRHVPQRTVAMQLLTRRCDSPFNCRDAGLEHDQTLCRRALCKHVSSAKQHAANAKYQTLTPSPPPSWWAGHASVNTGENTLSRQLLVLVTVNSPTRPAFW